jgi:sugar lactone lactonase YvrE
MPTLSNRTVNRARSLMFLSDGQIMVVTSYGSNSLVFFNRSNISPINYTFISKQLTNYPGPFGLWRVNDSFFYVTSYDNSSLYSYSNDINGLWKETFVFSTNQLSNTNGPTHVTIDDSNRFWFSLGTDTTLIYDQQGNLLANYTIPNSKIFDIKILNNYVMFFSDSGSNRIVRIDPNIQC